MSAYRILLNLALRSRLAALRSGSWRKENGRPDVARMVGCSLVGLGVLSLAAMLIAAQAILFSALKTLGQAALLPTLAMLLCMLSSVMMSFFHVLASLYFSRDIAWMAYLPVKSGTVLAAKMTEIYLGEALFACFVVLPGFVMYGLHLQAGVSYYLRMLVIALLSPVLPLAVTTLLATLLVRCTAIVRNREAWAMAGSVAMVAGIIWLEASVLPKVPEDAGALYIAGLLLRKDGLVDMVTGLLPPVRWAVEGLAGDWGQFMLFVLTCAAVAAGCMLLLGRDYLAICLKQTEQGSRRRRMRTDEGAFRQRSQWMALVRQEWREILRTPVYAFNCLSGVILFPMMLIIGIAGASAEVGMEQLRIAADGLIGALHPLDVTLILAAAMSLGGFVNPAVATAVSREGKRFSATWMLPVTARTFLGAKWMVGVGISMLSSAVAGLMIMALLPSLGLHVLCALALAMLLSCATSAACLTLDACRPNFHWDNETQLIKQSANVALGMLIGLVMYAMPIGAAALGWRGPAVLRMALVCAVLAAECAAGFLLLSMAEKRYARLENAA